MPIPKVVFRPDSADYLKQGFDKIADLLAITLGPTQGNVLSWSETKERAEMLDDAATIARRIVQIPDRRQDVGAMMLRQLVWRMHKEVGDGTATAAVLARALLHEGTKLVTAGATAVHIQRGIQKAVDMAIDAVQAMAIPAATEADLTAVAQAVTGDESLAWSLGEMFDLLGANAHIEVKKLVAPYLEREYIEGACWEGKLLAPTFINAVGLQRAIQSDCLVALYDNEVRTVADIGPLLTLAKQQPGRKLLFVAPNIIEEALNLLTAVHQHSKHQMNIIGFTINLGGEQGRSQLDDLALLTGATVMGEMMGRPLKNAKLDYLGRAERIEATKDHLYIARGHGDRTLVQEQLADLNTRFDTLAYDDAQRDGMERRIGQLAGRMGVLKVGAYTQPERDVLHQKAERAIRSLKATAEKGYVPGGGVAYARAAQQIDPDQAANADERLGMLAAQKALSAPFLQIMKNAHVAAPEVALNTVLATDERYVFDAVRRQLCPALEAGIVDPTKVVQRALEASASGAAMALSVDVTVLRQRPVTNVDYEP